MGKLIEFAGNHPLLASATIIMALAVLFYELRLKAAGVAALSATQAVQLINKGARIIDIRDRDKYDAAHIVDATHVAAADLEDYVSRKVKKTKSVVVVCDTGRRSGQVIAALRRAGHQNAFNLHGGLTAWKAANLPLVPTR